MVLKLGWKPLAFCNGPRGAASPSNQAKTGALDLNQIWYKRLEISPKFYETRPFPALEHAGLLP